MAVQHRGDELIIIDGQSIGYSIGDFWRWSASDLLSNTLRGSYCEFLVSAALGMDMGQTYVDWEPYDIAFPCRWWCDEVEQSIIRVEVKSSAYLQAVSFNQKKLSNPTFGIAPTRLQLPDGHYSPELKRQSEFTFSASMLNRTGLRPSLYASISGIFTYFLQKRWISSVDRRKQLLSVPCSSFSLLRQTLTA
jgi:hypothetical protein